VARSAIAAPETKMPDRKLIAVVGATGAQGHGLVRAILDDPAGGFAVRALTRDPRSDKAQALARAGAEVVAADVDDAASLDRAFAGCYGAYCVTFFWDHFSPEREIASVAAMAEAARRAGLRHVVWSTLEDTRQFVPVGDPRMPTLQGKYKVPHFDAKGEANAEFAVRGVPTTNLITSYYWDNLIYFGMGPKKQPDGTYAFVLPMGGARLAGIARDDIGRCAYGIFRKNGDLIGRTVGIAGDHLTGTEMAAKLTSALGVAVVHGDVPPEVYRTFGFPGADDLANMFQFNRDFEREALGARSLEFSRSVNPALQSFDDWLRANARRIPLD
jgi:uncharacterized protein YbjT (DUF2867 family)